MCIFYLLQSDTSPFFLSVNSLDLKTLLLGLEVGLRFKAWLNESSIIYYVVRDGSEMETEITSHYQ